MTSNEIKFLFEGIIFSSQILIHRVSGSVNRYEFTISFINRYLSSKYREYYYFISENKKFKPVYAKNEKEYELIKILQTTIIGMLSLDHKEIDSSDAYYSQLPDTNLLSN